MHQAMKCFRHFLLMDDTWRGVNVPKRLELPRLNIEAFIKRLEVNAAANPAVALSVPDWLFTLGKAELGDGWITELEALSQPPKQVLRVNTMGKQHLGTLSLKNSVVIPKEYNGDVSATIVLELHNMLMGGSLLLSGNPQKLAEKVKVTGKIRVKTGLFGKSFRFKDQSLGEVANQLKGTK